MRVVERPTRVLVPYLHYTNPTFRQVEERLRTIVCLLSSSRSTLDTPDLHVGVHVVPTKDLYRSNDGHLLVTVNAYIFHNLVDTVTPYLGHIRILGNFKMLTI